MSRLVFSLSWLSLLCFPGWLGLGTQPAAHVSQVPATPTEIVIPLTVPTLRPQPAFKIAVSQQSWLTSTQSPTTTFFPTANRPLVQITNPPPSPLQGWPVSAPKSQAFGCSDFDTGISGQFAGCSAERPFYHDGLDLAVPVNTPVRASITGTVIFAGPDGQGPNCNGGYVGYGLGVVIDNDSGWQALYAHLGRIDVTVGDSVHPDQIIGLSGNTGCSSGPHLHFGLRYEENLVDPGSYLR